MNCENTKRTLAHAKDGGRTTWCLNHRKQCLSGAGDPLPSVFTNVYGGGQRQRQRECIITEHVWRSEDNFLGPVFSFHLVWRQGFSSSCFFARFETFWLILSLCPSHPRSTVIVDAGHDTELYLGVQRLKLGCQARVASVPPSPQPPSRLPHFLCFIFR